MLKATAMFMRSRRAWCHLRDARFAQCKPKTIHEYLACLSQDKICDKACAILLRVEHVRLFRQQVLFVDGLTVCAD